MEKISPMVMRKKIKQRHELSIDGGVGQAGPRGRIGTIVVALEHPENSGIRALEGFHPSGLTARCGHTINISSDHCPQLKKVSPITSEAC